MFLSKSDTLQILNTYAIELESNLVALRNIDLEKKLLISYILYDRLFYISGNNSLYPILGSRDFFEEIFDLFIFKKDNLIEEVRQLYIDLKNSRNHSELISFLFEPFLLNEHNLSIFSGLLHISNAYKSKCKEISNDDFFEFYTTLIQKKYLNYSNQEGNHNLIKEVLDFFQANYKGDWFFPFTGLEDLFCMGNGWKGYFFLSDSFEEMLFRLILALNENFSNAQISPQYLSFEDQEMKYNSFYVVGETEKIHSRKLVNRPFFDEKLAVVENDEVYISEACIQKMIYCLGDDQCAVLLVSNHLLEGDNTFKSSRNFLLKKDCLSFVIGLPKVLDEAKSKSFSLLVLKKQKFRPGFIGFIDLQRNKTDESLTEVLQLLMQPEINFPIAEEIQWADTFSIREKKLNLNPKRYTSKIVREIQLLQSVHNFVPLQQLIKNEMAQLWLYSHDALVSQYKYIGIDELVLAQNTRYFLTSSLVNCQDIIKNMEGRLLDQPAILFGSRDGVIFTAILQSNEKFFLSEEISFLIPSEQVELEYLYFVLQSSYFKEQYELYKADDAVELYQILDKILLPISHKENQLLQIQKEKENWLIQEEKKLEFVREMLQVKGNVASQKQYQLLSSLQHELGNKLPAIYNQFYSLKDYLHKLDSTGKISLQDSIYDEELQVEFGIESPKVEGLIGSIEKLIRQTVETLEATNSIIRADISHMQIEVLSPIDFFKDLIIPFQRDKKYHIHLEYDDKSAWVQDLKFKCDRRQLEMLISNLLLNAEKHGFQEGENHRILFKLHFPIEKEMMIVEYTNTGKAFPKDFTMQDFLSFGKYAGKTGNTGIGGFLIHQIVENHNAQMKFYNENVLENLYKFKIEFYFPLTKIKI